MAERRILVVAHGHPELSKGGGEAAAYAQFRELRRRDGWRALFMARAPADRGHPGTPFSARRDDEILWHSDMPDLFRLSQPNKHIVWSAFRELLGQFRPDVVHFHHYLHLGVELLGEVKRWNPATRVVVTLHEYWALCHQHGQMLKARTQELCTSARPADCHACFPQYSPGDFLLRELFVKSWFDHVDRFVAPSEFLKRRYVAWGLPADRISVVENGQEHIAPQPPRPLAEGEGRARFAFFGQLNPYKGVDVLLEAIPLLPKSVRKQLSVEIHGANLRLQAQEFRERFTRALEGAGRHASFTGPYEHEHLPGLMARADWVVVPSIWWENSPLVIQEAFAHGRPVICSDIGGMAEKVSDGVDGLHFRVGSAADLARRMMEAATTPGLWDRLQAGVKAPPTIGQSVDALMTSYDR